MLGRLLSSLWSAWFVWTDRLRLLGTLAGHDFRDNDGESYTSGMISFTISSIPPTPSPESFVLDGLEWQAKEGLEADAAWEENEWDLALVSMGAEVVASDNGVVVNTFVDGL